MKLLPRWIASVLTIGVVLALSFCGAMTVSAMTTHGGSAVDTMHCSDGMCPASPVSCATECLQKLDGAQQRALAGIVTMVLSSVFALVCFTRFDFYDREHVLCAPPWRSHRLFAFRE